MRSFHVLAVAFCLLFTSVAAQAATVIARNDESMTKAARAIAVGTVVEVAPRYNDRGAIETVARLLVDETIKGEIEAGTIVEVVQYGGMLDGNFQAQSGAPAYQVGARYLVFLDTNRAGHWTTFDLALGQFRFRFQDGMEMLQRDTGEIGGWWESGRPFRDGNRLAGRFLQYVRELAKEHAARQNYWVDGAPDSGTVSSVIARPGINVLDFDLRGTTEDAVAEWGGDAGSSMPDSVSATAATGNTELGSDCESRVIGDDPNSDISGTFSGSGVVATAFFGCSSSCGGCTVHTFNSESYGKLSTADIVVQDGVSSSNFTAAKFLTTMIHELGHTWGFRHSNRNKSEGSCSLPLECTSTAIMNSSVISATTLRPYDLSAANEVYGDGSAGSFAGSTYVTEFDFGGATGIKPMRRPSGYSWRIVEVDTSCGGPTINTQPANKTIGGGQTTSMSVAATSSSGTLSYVWYTGTSGNTSSPVGGGTTSSINVTPGSTTSYWVRVTDQCGDGDNTEDSAAGTVTVNCTPTINTQPSNKNISSGASTSLSVTSTQATIYQWYQVNDSASNTDETNPVGSNSSSFNTGTLTNNGDSPIVKKYWVKVSTNCGFTRSSVASVTVTPAGSGCTSPSISSEPADVSIGSGTPATLTVIASGTATLSYQWYQGSKPSTATPVGTGSNVYVTPNLTADTKYWVRVTNSCGTKDSRTVTVDVVSCTLPAVTSITPGGTITSGTAATLTVAGTNTTTVTWFRGALGDETQPVGSGATITSPVLTETTTFWAKLTNSCGSTPSTLVTITVVTACTAPVITVEPLSQKVLKNSSVNLSVIASGGTPMSYQWFEGAAGVMTKPVGVDSSLYSSGPLAKSTKFWVLVTNACGTDQSSTAAITIPAKRRAVRR